MLNEYVYCPRLFFYEWVIGVFQENADTLEGKSQHKRVDAVASPLPSADELDDTMRSRSVSMSSDRYGVIARMDLIEVNNGAVTPVDYKHGQPREAQEGLQLWPADRIQLAVQCLILRDNGYQCDEGLVYYFKTKQRVRVQFDDALFSETLQVIEEARSVAASGVIPPPLVDSPKCPGCSLVGICLPDETAGLSLPREMPEKQGIQLSLFEDHQTTARKSSPVRRLIAPRDDLRPAYLNTHGMRVGKSGDVLQVRDKQSTLKQEMRIREISQLNLLGNIQITTQAVQALCENGIPICYFSQGGWFYGITTGMNVKNVFLRKSQYRLADEQWFALSFARQLIAGKIRNQRTLLQRNHIEPRAITLQQMKNMAERAEQASDMEELLGIEGNAARLYFGDFSGMIKTEEQTTLPPVRLRFFKAESPAAARVNALLSFVYSLLAKDCTIACYAVGLDPMLGFYHQPRLEDRLWPLTLWSRSVL